MKKQRGLSQVKKKSQHSEEQGNDKKEAAKAGGCFGSVMAQTARLIRHRFIQQKLYSMRLEMLFLSIFL